MPFTLVSVDGPQKFEIRDGDTAVVGRAPTSDVPIFDPTISRRHAELRVEANGLHVRDVGSSNGTYVNGGRIDEAMVAEGDLLTFGKVAFRLQRSVPRPSTPTLAGAAGAAGGGATPPGATIVRQLPLKGAGLGVAPLRDQTTPPGARAAVTADKNQQKLATLLEVSQGLGKSTGIGPLLEKIVRYADQILEIDRVAILLMDEAGELIPKIGRDKRGSETSRAIPQSIARKAVADKVAILSDNAGEDTRFGGQSILMQQIRSAVCCPLVGSEDRVLGVLYVDNVTTTHRFSEEDLEFCIAFAGIAAVAIENEQFAQRIQRELLVRSNFQRYFAPALAERIASSPDATRLGGEKRPVAVLFSDIRGFTSLSETMLPDDMATLLTEYFTEMVECVFRNGGTLDKFIGDSVMAQWGAPLHTEDDPDHAMTSAIDMMKALDALNAKWRSEGRPELQHGIGLNFGEAFAGNIGSERRLEFTVIGDTVNTASRLCAAAGAGEILLSDEMRKMLTAPPALEECPPMELKNKSQPVKVFRVAL